MNDPLRISLSVRVYRGLLRTYPREFRQEYGEAMVQVFRDLCLRSGEAGLFRVWGRALLDYAVSLVSEHMERGMEMTKTKWIQLSGWALAASGFLLMAGFAASSRPDYNPYNAAAWPIDPILNRMAGVLITVAMLLMSAGLAGLLERFQEKASRLGLGGLFIGSFAGLIGAVGAVGMGFFQNGPWWNGFMFGLLGVNLGLALFGIDCLRQHLFARWNGLPLAIGSVFLAFGLAMTGPIHIEWPGVLEFVVLLAFALGLGLVGYLHLSERTEMPTTTEA
jgi:hypothetical protein